MVGNAKGNDETMTGAHLGGRGVGRRRGSAAIAAPPEAGRRTVAAMVMGATIWIFGARFFGTFWQRTRDALVMVAYLCSWTRPNVSKAALLLLCL